MGEYVSIFEMAPRDGLQNEKRQIPTEEKIRLVDLLTNCGFEKIEVASFVSPKWVPQMADSAEVLKGIKRGRAAYTALTPNLKGYERARDAKVDEVAIFASASEGFSQANINCSIAESIARFEPVLEAAKADGMAVRGYVSCVVRCPYDGDTAPQAVADVSARLLEMGCYEISLGDTIGTGTPETIAPMLEAVLGVAPPMRFAGHYHDTNNRALDNISASLALGLRTFDSAVGGLGGCPYAPGSKGNVATEDVVVRLEQEGFETGIDVSALREAATFARTLRSE
jgi:hydroxymethylglutaryl-CoA lyase